MSDYKIDPTMFLDSESDAFYSLETAPPKRGPSKRGSHRPMKREDTSPDHSSNSSRSNRKAESPPRKSTPRMQGKRNNDYYDSDEKPAYKETARVRTRPMKREDSSPDYPANSRNNRKATSPTRKSPPRMQGKRSTVYYDSDFEPANEETTRKIFKEEVCDMVADWSSSVKNQQQKRLRVAISLSERDDRFVLLRGSHKEDVLEAKGKLIAMAENHFSKNSQVLKVPSDVMSSRHVTQKIRDINRNPSISIRAKPDSSNDDELTYVTVQADEKDELEDAVEELTKTIKEALKITRKNKTKPSVISFSSEEEAVPDVPRYKGKVREDSDAECTMNAAAAMPQLTPDHKKYPKLMNILVLGETGVGKSTFINGLINYLQYNTMDEALDGGVSILIKSSFVLTDDNFKSCPIVTESTIPEETGTNEVLGQGQSATQEPKSYVFRWQDGTEMKSIRIIDTPGIGDTRGVEQDKKNFESIMSFLSDYSEIHGILILVKPNTARLTVAFRFCIDELLVHLHKSASKNLLFCFTNTRSTLYKPGDTLPILQAHLDKLAKDRNIVIPVSKSTMFSFDNEAFRFLCARMAGFEFTEEEQGNFAGSWTMSTKETLRLFSQISALPVHKVDETLCLNNTRAAIITLSKPLAEIARNQLINTKLIEDKMQEIKDHAKAGKDLKDSLYVDQVVLNTEKLSYPMTVCTSTGCVTHSKVGSSPNAPVETVYSTVCHDHCYLTGVQEKIFPNVALQKCAAMKGLNCSKCSCLWSTHMHVTYRLNKSMVKVADPTVQKSIKDKENAVDTIKVFLQKQQQNVDQLKAESNKITNYCAEFAAFLSANSIRPYNDSFKQYMDHLIKEEEEKIGAGGSSDLLLRMQKYRDEYEAQIKLLEVHLKNPSAKPRTVAQMNKMVEDLKNMKNSGSVLADVENLQVLSVRQTQKYLDRTVPIVGWFAGTRQAIRKAGNMVSKNIHGK